MENLVVIRVTPLFVSGFLVVLEVESGGELVQLLATLHWGFKAQGYHPYFCPDNKTAYLLRSAPVMYEPCFSCQQCTQQIVHKSLSVKLRQGGNFEFMKRALRNCHAHGSRLPARGGWPSDKDTSTQHVILLPCWHFYGRVNLSTHCHNACSSRHLYFQEPIIYTIIQRK